MLYNSTSFEKIVLIAMYVKNNHPKYNYNMDPFEKNTLYMFCGRSASKIKALQWEGDGFALLTKWLEDGKYHWPRNRSEALNLTQEQFEWLMKGLPITPSIRKIDRQLTI